MNKELFAKLFKEGEVIDSGGPVNRANHARLRILSIGDVSVHYQSIKAVNINHFRYSNIDAVLEGFDQIDPKSIQPSIQKVFVEADLRKNYSTENYIYGFAKEIRRRLAILEQPILSSGELLDPPGAAEDGGMEGPLTEGAFLRIWVNSRERSGEAVRLCKEQSGVQCMGCGFDFETFYGPFGAGFIHAHHLQALSKSDGVYAIDPAKDLVPLCPNCHAMVHHGMAMLTIPELKELIATARKAATNRAKLAGQVD